MRIKSGDSELLSEIAKQAKTLNFHEFVEKLYLHTEERDEVFLEAIQFLYLPFKLKRFELRSYYCTLGETHLNHAL